MKIRKELPALPGTLSNTLNHNPDRGFRLEVSFVKANELLNASDRKAYAREKILGELDNCAPFDITIAQNYFYLWPWLDSPISEDALSAFQDVFDVYREMNIKVLQRFSYQRECHRGGAETERILGHIRQLKPLIERNRDVIYCFQTGFIGAWGEWHSDVPAADRTKILKAVAEELVPDDMYLQLRLPEYKEFLSPNHPAYRKIGFNNDCFFGKINAEYYGSGGWDPDTAMWRTSVAQSPFCPMDAELYWSFWNFENNIFCDGYDAVTALSELHMTTFSAMHGYGDLKKSADRRGTIARWMEQPITEEWLKAHGIPFSPAWFADENGKKLTRNVFEFVRDHFGYRLEARSVEVSGESAPGECVNVCLEIANTGFSAPFNLRGAFALLDDDGNAVSVFPIDGIDHWHPTSPLDYSDRTVLIHKVFGTLAVPEKEQKLRLGFRLYSTLGSGVVLANTLENAGGYYILTGIN